MGIAPSFAALIIFHHDYGNQANKENIQNLLQLPCNFQKQLHESVL